MTADRLTAASNLKHNFTPEESLAYPDLPLLLARLRGIYDDDCTKIDFGGDPVFSQKEVVENLLAEGRAFPGAKIQDEIMTVKECHANTAELVKQRPHLKHIRGWAVGTCWKPHSWAWDPKENIIYETTGLTWAHYFGSEFSVRE